MVSDASHIDKLTQPIDFEHDCEPHLSLRERRVGKGTAYVQQCLFCGEQRGGALPKAKVTGNPPQFIDGISEKYWARRQEIYSQLSNSGAVPPRSEQNEPQAKTESEQFEDELLGLFERYRSCWSEQRFQEKLRHTLIRSREEKINSMDLPWNNEPELTSWLIDELSPWFYVWKEVRGRGYLDQNARNVRIDLVIRPKPHLVEYGFVDELFGIEIKYLNPKTGNNFSKKSSKSVFQALSYWYSGARWDLKDGQGYAYRLSSVLLFSNFSFSDEADELFGSYDQYYRTTWRSYLALANHGNVGELQVSGNKSHYHRLSFHYSGVNYCLLYKDGNARIGNPNLINKMRIGNAQ